MFYLRKLKYATTMTVKTFMKSDKNLTKKGNKPKDYMELFLFFYKMY